MNNAKKPHIHLTQDSRYERVIVCGSPDRAAVFAQALENPVLVAKNREYHSYLGQYDGVSILVTSHGVGSAGAAICFQELIDVGAKAMIRIGTAGGLYDETRIGDIAVATSAVRKDGVSNLMVPTAYPAVASRQITSHLIAALEAKNIDHRDGVVVTSDLFYPGPMGDDLELFARAGAIAVEMECSTLFVIGALRKIQTGAMLVLDGNPLKWSEGHYDPNPERLKSSMTSCLLAALETLKSVRLG